MSSEQSSSEVLLITGGAGYLGSRLIRDLAADPDAAGSVVRIVDNLQRSGYGALMDLPGEGRFQFVEADILDSAAMRQALEGVSAVVHLAALVRTPFSFEHPAWTEQVNHWGTVRLLELCREAGVSRFLYAGSASVYGLGGDFDEESPCRPVGPYSQSKARAEEAVLQYGKSGLSVTVLRLGTLFGSAPSMRFEAVPNRFAYLAGIGRPLTVFGSGEQVRPLVHVADACAALRMALTDLADSGEQVLNVVGCNPSVGEVVEAVKKARPAVRVHYTEQDVLSHLSFRVDGARLRGLGWSPDHSLEEGLAEVCERFRAVAVQEPGSAQLAEDY